MNVEEYLTRSRLFQHLKDGAQGQLIERYAARLIEDGLGRQSTWRCLNVVGGLLSWIASRRFKPSRSRPTALISSAFSLYRASGMTKARCTF